MDKAERAFRLLTRELASRGMRGGDGANLTYRLSELTLVATKSGTRITPNAIMFTALGGNFMIDRTGSLMFIQLVNGESSIFELGAGTLSASLLTYLEWRVMTIRAVEM
jgi:hypothetical protein